MQRSKFISSLVAFAVAFCLLPQAHAQSVYFDFKFGAFYPAELPGGLYPNLALHKTLDSDGVLKWDIGVGAGYYRRSYRDLVYVTSGLGPSPAADEVNFTRRVTPLLFKLTMKISLLEMNLPGLPGARSIAKAGMARATDLKDFGFLLRPYAADFELKSEESNETSGNTITRTYKCSGWGAELGTYISTVQNVTTTISVLYNRASAKLDQGQLIIRDSDETVGLPIAKKIKLHGYVFMLSMGWGF